MPEADAEDLAQQVLMAITRTIELREIELQEIELKHAAVRATD